LAKRYHVVLASVYPEVITARLPKDILPLPVYQVPVKKIWLGLGIFHFLRVIIKEKIDLLFVPDIVLSIYSRFFQLFFRRLKNITIIQANYKKLHYRWSFIKKIIFFLDRISFFFVNKYICISSYLAEQLKDDGVPLSRIEMVYHGIDFSKFSLIQIKPFQDKPYCVAYIGRMTCEKGIDYFVDLAESMLGSGNDIQFHVFGVGKNDKANELQKKHPQSFFLHGFVKETFGSNKIDIVVVPSRDEGLGLVALEAFAYGIPVIASKVGSLAEIIADGQTGILCPVGDIKAYSQAIKDLINDSGLRNRMVKNAKKYVFLKFSLEDMKKRYLEIIEQVLAI